MVDENQSKTQLNNETNQFERWSAELENFESIVERSGQQGEYNSLLMGAVLNNLPNPFYVIDASDYTIKAANSAAHFASMLKDSSYCYALTHQRESPCGSESHPCPLETIKETKKPLTVEHLHYDQDGNPRNVEVHAFPIFDNKGNVSHIIEYILDITERKRAENELKWELSVTSALSMLYKPLISQKTTIETVAGIVLEQAKTLTGSKHGYVSEIHPTTGDNISHTLTEMMKDQCGVSEINKKVVFPRCKDGLYPALWGYTLNSREAFYANSPERHQAAAGIPEGHILHLPPSSGHIEKLNAKLKKEVCPCRRRVEGNMIQNLKERQFDL